MVSYYSIFGKQVASQWIAIGTLGTVGALTILPGYLPKSDVQVKAAPAPVQTKKEDDIDVEKLLNDYLKEAEKEEAK